MTTEITSAKTGTTISKVELHEFAYDAPDMGFSEIQRDLIALPGASQRMSKFAIVIETLDGSRGEYVGMWGATQMSLAQTRDLAPRLLGRDALQRESIYDDFKRAHRQYDHMGLGYIDICLWDLAGKRYGSSVSELLGGWRTRLPAYASTTHGDNAVLASPEAYGDFAEACYELGYRAFKMHGWSDGNVEREISTIDLLGERVGDRMALMSDPASQLRTFLDAVRVGRACDANEFAWLEDPFRDTGVSANGHKRLRELIRTPLLMGEHVRGLEPKADLAMSGATDLLRSDPEYDMGITGAMKIAHLGEALGIDVEIHASGPAHRHCMSAMRNTNYYEVALVNPAAARACLPNRLIADWKAWGVSRFQVFTDDQWARVAPLLPSSDGQRGRPFRNHRQVVEGIAYRYRCGIAWRDLPEQFGPWQTVWKRHRRFAADGIWDRIHAVLLSEADAAGEIDWTVSVDSTINRAHQHGTNLPRNTGGRSELQETLGGA